MTQVGRNEPCPCGSGKKYKKCCLLKEAPPRPKGLEETMMQELFGQILKFARKHFAEELFKARDLFLGDRKRPEMELDALMTNLGDWIVHDWMPDERQGKTLVKLFKERGGRLRPDQIDVLDRMAGSVVSLYEVLEVVPDEGMRLADLILQDRYEVAEKLATRQAVKGDILAARLLDMDGRWVMSGGVLAYPKMFQSQIMTALSMEFRKYAKQFPGSSKREFLKRRSILFRQQWDEVRPSPSRFKMQTTTGEPFMICKALFAVRDLSAVRKNLEEAPALENGGKNRYAWLADMDGTGEKAKAAAVAAGRTLLGSITIDPDKKEMVLECMSRERLERGKRLILEALGSCARHVTDTFQDPVALLQQLSGRADDHGIPADDVDAVPPEVRQLAYEKIMKVHYEKWLSESIPVLDGKTPRAAVRTRKGREKVTQLLKELENREEHNRLDGRPFFDTSWLWDRLKLDRDA